MMAAGAFEKCQKYPPMMFEIQMLMMIMLIYVDYELLFATLMLVFIQMLMMILVMISPRSVADLLRGEFEEDQRWRLADWKRPRGADRINGKFDLRSPYNPFPLLPPP